MYCHIPQHITNKRKSQVVRMVFRPRTNEGWWSDRDVYMSIVHWGSMCINVGVPMKKGADAGPFSALKERPSSRQGHAVSRPTL